jgi:hypothetical protein
VSGFTHRVTNQVHGADVRGREQIDQLLGRGWVDDPLWLLRTVHEVAHVDANLTPLGEALVQAELALDNALYESMSGDDGHQQLVRGGRDSLSLANELLSPWFEAVALITEWDLDLSVPRPPNAHRWIGRLIGTNTYDEHLWHARFSDLGVGRKAITLVSSCYGGGHLLGHLLSRVLGLLGDRRANDVLAEIVRSVLSNIELAHAILDLAENVGSSAAVESARERLIEKVAGAVEGLCDELLSGRRAEFSADLEEGLDALLQRMQPLRNELQRPVVLPRWPTDTAFFVDMPRAIAHGSYALRALVGLGTARVQLAARAEQVVCRTEGEEVYSFENKTGLENGGAGTIEVSFCALCGPDTRGIRVLSDTDHVLHAFGNDDHIVTAFKRGRVATERLEGGQAAAALLASAAGANPVPPTGPAPGRQLAASLVQYVIDQATGAAINLESLSKFGVATALDHDRDRVETLARLSNESSSLRTESGRAALPNGPTVSDAEISDLSTRLKGATGIALAARTESRAVVLW